MTDHYRIADFAREQGAGALHVSYTDKVATYIPVRKRFLTPFQGAISD
jgi:hypothetical protein